MKHVTLVISVVMTLLGVGLSVASASDGKIAFGLLWGLLAAAEASIATLKFLEIRGETS